MGYPAASCMIQYSNIGAVAGHMVLIMSDRPPVIKGTKRHRRRCRHHRPNLQSLLPAGQLEIPHRFFGHGLLGTFRWLLAIIHAVHHEPSPMSMCALVLQEDVQARPSYRISHGQSHQGFFVLRTKRAMGSEMLNSGNASSLATFKLGKSLYRSG